MFTLLAHIKTLHAKTFIITITPNSTPYCDKETFLNIWKKAHYKVCRHHNKLPQYQISFEKLQYFTSYNFKTINTSCALLCFKRNKKCPKKSSMFYSISVIKQIFRPLQWMAVVFLLLQRSNEHYNQKMFKNKIYGSWVNINCITILLCLTAFNRYQRHNIHQLQATEVR